MGYSSEFTPHFLRLLKKLDPQTKERILDSVKEILDSPRAGSQLVYSQQIEFKWRVGDYRIIYLIDDRRKTVLFVIVDHRGRVYKRQH